MYKKRITLEQAKEVFRTMSKVYTRDMVESKRMLVYNVKTEQLRFVTDVGLKELMSLPQKVNYVLTGLYEVSFYDAETKKRITQDRGHKYIYKHVNKILNDESVLRDVESISNKIEPFNWVVPGPKSEYYRLTLDIDKPTKIKRMFKQYGKDYDGNELSDFVYDFIDRQYRSGIRYVTVKDYSTYKTLDITVDTGKRKGLLELANDLSELFNNKYGKLEDLIKNTVIPTKILKLTKMSQSQFLDLDEVQTGHSTTGYGSAIYYNDGLVQESVDIGSDLEWEELATTDLINELKKKVIDALESEL